MDEHSYKKGVVMTLAAIVFSGFLLMSSGPAFGQSENLFASDDGGLLAESSVQSDVFDGSDRAGTGSSVNVSGLDGGFARDCPVDAGGNGAVEQCAGQQSRSFGSIDGPSELPGPVMTDGGSSDRRPVRRLQFGAGVTLSDSLDREGFDRTEVGGDEVFFSLHRNRRDESPFADGVPSEGVGADPFADGLASSDSGSPFSGDFSGPEMGDPFSSGDGPEMDDPFANGDGDTTVGESLFPS